jgi:tetratricopeptide (TPR) repeat protein
MNSTITHRNRQNLCNSLLGCCFMTSNLTPQKKPHPNQSISSQAAASNSQSVKVNASLATYVAKGETEKAIDHLKAALRIADSFSWDTQQFSTLCSLAELFCNQGRFDDAHAHVERAKSHTVNGTHRRGRVMELQAHIWYKQGRLEEAKAEALRAVDVFKKLGATRECGEM